MLRDVHAAVAWAIEEGWGALYAITVERTYLRHRVVAYDQMSGKESLEEVCARYWGILEQLAGLWETERFLPGRCFAAFREASKGMALKEKVRMEMSLGLDDVSEPLVPEWVVYGEDDVDEGGEVDEKGECDDVANGEARLN